MGNIFITTQKKFRRLQNRKQIPETIEKQYPNGRTKIFAGLFPEINRAYITIDHKIFLWDYDRSNFPPVYHELSEAIISVALVKPKPGIFDPQFKHILVLSSRSYIVLMAVRVDEYNELHLKKTKFTLCTDNVHMLTMIGTDSGRIFMGGKNGHVYEFDYQAEDGWIQKSSRKIDHSVGSATGWIKSLLPSGMMTSMAVEDPIIDMVVDSTRSIHYLFTVSKEATIQIISLGQDGSGFEILETKTETAYLKEIKNNLKQPSWMTKQQDFRIIALAPIPKINSEESKVAKSIVLVGVTRQGHRIFFSFDLQKAVIGNHFQKLAFPHSNNPFHVKFVRLCPPAIQSSDVGSFTPKFKDQINGSPKKIRSIFIHNNVFLAVEAKQHGDICVCISQTNSLANGQLNESVESDSPNTRIHAISEICPSNYMNIVSRNLYARNQNAPLVGLNEFATQHVLPPRRFLCLTGRGLYTYEKYRPIDELRQILSSTAHKDLPEALKNFENNYGLSEACAMCLILILPISISTRSSDEYENHPSNTRTPPSQYSALPEKSNKVQSLAVEAFFNYGKKYGGLLPGLALYLSRLLRPTYDWSITVPSGNPNELRLRFSLDELNELIKPLKELKKFMKKNEARLYRRVHYQNLALEADRTARKAHPAYPAGIGPNIGYKDAETLKDLIAFLDLYIEAFHLLIVFAQQKHFPKLVASLEKDQQDELRTIDLKTFAISRKDIAKRLIDALMSNNRNLLQTRARWVNELHEKCPSYFGNTQLLHYKGHAVLEKAMSCKQKDERDNLLKQALQYYIQTVKYPIQDVCEKLCAANYYTGVVYLCFYRLALLDRGEISSSENQVGFQKQEKHKCFDIILKTIEIINTKTYEKTNALGRNDQKRQVLALCMKSNDADFYNCFFQLFIDKDWKSDLFEMTQNKNEHLIHFLASKRTKQHETILVEYLLSHEMYAEAKTLLNELAHKSTNDYDLDERYFFLNRAIGCATKCVDESVHYGDQLSQIHVEHQFVGEQLQIRNRLGDNIKELKKELESNPQQMSEAKTLVSRHFESFETYKEFSNQVEFGYIPPYMVQYSWKKQLHARLNFKILDLNQLYQIALDYEFWDLGLSILSFNGDQNKGHSVKNLWSNAFRSKIKSAYDNGLNWSHAVRNQFVKLSKKYMNKPFMFPLDFIIQQLEELNYKFPFEKVKGTKYVFEVEKQWFVWKTLSEANIKHNRLLRIYMRLVELYSQKEDSSMDSCKVLIFWTIRHLLHDIYTRKVRSCALSSQSCQQKQDISDILIYCNNELDCIRTPTINKDQLTGEFRRLKTNFEPYLRP